MRRSTAVRLTRLALLVSGACLPMVVGAQTYSFPVMGTLGADVVEVQALATDVNGNQVVRIEINGNVREYAWESEWKPRIIDTLAGKDEVTISIQHTFVILGGGGHDTINGSEAADVVLGEGGNDVIHTNGGNDWISGGIGNDEFHAGAGNDVVYGDEDNDFLAGGQGRDVLDGRAGCDEIRGGYNDDMLYGGTESDELYGGDGDDLLYGGDGADDLRGDAGDDILLGGGGTDDLLDGSVVSEDDYNAQRLQMVQEIESEFGVLVRESDRIWTLEELGFLDTALSRVSPEVFRVWDGAPVPEPAMHYFRKQCCELPGPGYGPYEATGLHSVGIYVYDGVWRRDDADLKPKWIKTIIHETGHSYAASPALTAQEMEEFKELSGWSGVGDSMTHDPNANFISDYAQSNVEEDWAETFAYYFADPNPLIQDCPEKFAFMQEEFGKYFGPETIAVAPAPGDTARPFEVSDIEALPGPDGKRPEARPDTRRPDRPLRPRRIGPRPRPQ